MGEFVTLGTVTMMRPTVHRHGATSWGHVHAYELGGPEGIRPSESLLRNKFLPVARQEVEDFSVIPSHQEHRLGWASGGTDRK